MTIAEKQTDMITAAETLFLAMAYTIKWNLMRIKEGKWLESRI
jgi:hypothetical protein